MLALLIGGLGASTQHPIASALVARAFSGTRSLQALGTYNFAGDIGKMTMPAAATLLLLLMPWQPTLALLGALGIVAAVVIYQLTPRLPAEPLAVAKEEKARAASERPRARRYGFPAAAVDRHDRQRHAAWPFSPFCLSCW